MTLVLDASVAVKAFLAEADSPAAVAVLAGPDPLLAPALLRVEVAAAITKRHRLGDLDPDGVRSALARWEAYLARGRVQVTEDIDLLPDAIMMAMNLRHPVYDCVYLALSDRHRAPLVTADRVFLRRAGPQFPGLRPLTPDLLDPP